MSKESGIQQLVNNVNQHTGGNFTRLYEVSPVTYAQALTRNGLSEEPQRFSSIAEIHKQGVQRTRELDILVTNRLDLVDLEIGLIRAGLTEAEQPIFDAEMVRFEKARAASTRGLVGSLIRHNRFDQISITAEGKVKVLPTDAEHRLRGIDGFQLLPQTATRVMHKEQDVFFEAMEEKLQELSTPIVETAESHQSPHVLVRFLKSVRAYDQKLVDQSPFAQDTRESMHVFFKDLVWNKLLVNAGQITNVMVKVIAHDVKSVIKSLPAFVRNQIRETVYETRKGMSIAGHAIWDNTYGVAASADHWIEERLEVKKGLRGVVQQLEIPQQARRLGRIASTIISTFSSL